MCARMEGDSCGGSSDAAARTGHASAKLAQLAHVSLAAPDWRIRTLMRSTNAAPGDAESKVSRVYSLHIMGKSIYIDCALHSAALVLGAPIARR